MGDHRRKDDPMSEYSWYEVVSGEYKYEEKIPGLMRGPVYPIRDVAVVKARNANEAKWEATRLWEKHHRRGDCWPKMMRSDGRHPLSEVTAIRWGEQPGFEQVDDIDLPEPSESWEPYYSDLSQRETADA